jgi:hypothetical protein
MKTTATGRIVSGVLSICATSVLFGGVALLFSPPNASAGVQLAGNSYEVVASTLQHRGTSKSR